VDEGKFLAMDTVENLKRLYRGKKTVEVTIAGADPSAFYDSLQAKLAGSEVKADGNSAVILTDDPKGALQRIVELSQTTGVQMDWLNVRKNTLEDVFIGSVTKAERE